jgi:hypothetical protein
VLSFARDLEAAAKSVGLDPTASAVTESVRELFGEVLDERRETLRGLLSKGAAATPSTAPPSMSGPTFPEPTATRTRSAHFRGSISDARTIPFTRTPEVAVPPAGEVTHDITSLVNATEPAPLSAKPRRRWLVPVGIGIAAGIALGSLAIGANRKSSLEASPFEASSKTGPSPASEVPSAASTASEAIGSAKASNQALDASAAASASASASAAPADKTKVSERPFHPRLKPAPAPSAESSHAPSDSAKHADHPGLGY